MKNKGAIDVDIHEVKVVLPHGGDLNPEEIVRDNAQWILDKQKKYKRYQEQAPNREFEEGEEFSFLGKKRRLSIKGIDESKVTEDRILLPETKVNSSSVQDELEAFYRREA